MQFHVKSALLRSWLKQPRAHEHTNIYVFLKENSGGVTCESWIHAPEHQKPWGIELPTIDCICSCTPSSGGLSFWRKKYHRPTKVAGEVYYFFATSCCKYELHLAVFVESQTLLRRHGTEVFVMPINADGEQGFDYYTMVDMQFRVSESSSDRG